MTKLRRGEIVKHVTGGPTMVVTWVSNGYAEVAARWYDLASREFKKQTFCPEELKKVAKPAPRSEEE